MKVAKATRAMPSHQVSMGMIETTMVVKEVTAIHYSPDGAYSYGQFVDEHLCEMARCGNTVQSITLHIPEEMWSDIRAANQPMQAVED